MRAFSDRAGQHRSAGPKSQDVRHVLKRAGAAATAVPRATKQQRVEHVVERNGRRVQRYPLDGSPPALYEDDSLPQGSALEQGREALKGFALPRGWPSSVTPDYLSYQVRAVPSHITGWISVSLATSSLLRALGASPGPAGTAASAAAIKWITKDGIGAAGRLLVGGRLGGVFDEDPRRWRLMAEIFTTIGLSLEIATAFNPGAFVVLAGSGNFFKAVGKGLGRPCFRIIQTHFALQNNVGDISAKEEVWEVAAQLTGLASSVAILRAIEASHVPIAVLPAWGAAQSAHVILRYFSLRTLQFSFLNQKRACAAVHAHIRGQRLPGVQATRTCCWRCCRLLG
ncbi:hypothetical protein WJX73_001836 [Symbiochloris irregularis]|uniref:Protein root UVB sensitive/RUS domain-containing protein n=1 Tax=Symbiochloris irregularis TaxID=706552 RepID=A0AAW1NNN9_9CHLO